LSLQHSEFLAAIDLGSNSFHMILAKKTPVGFKQTVTAKESVCLARGLVKDHHISDAAFAAGIGCITRFAAILKAYQIDTVRVVGTHSLRVAKNATQFIEQAEQILQHKIEIISGEEEAELTYMGLIENDDPKGHHLVVDIGGGSTELVEGKGKKILHLHSLHLGCVTLGETFFPNGVVTKAALMKTKELALEQLQRLPKEFRAYDAKVTVTSGTGQALQSVLQKLKNKKVKRISVEHIAQVESFLSTLSNASELTEYGLLPDRALVFPPGFMILSALISFFGVHQLHVVYGALRDGLLQSVSRPRQSSRE